MKRFFLLVLVLLIMMLLSACGGGRGYYYQPPTTPTPPSAPYNLSAEAVSHSTVKLQWIDNSDNEEGFRIYRGNNLVATVDANVTTYQNTGLKPATTYQYVVKAYNQAGESATPVCTVRTPNPPITVRLDRIGVYDNGEHWLRGEAGEVYVGIIVTDGNTAVEKRFPAGESQFYKLRENEIVDVGATIFSVDEVGDYIRIAAIGYEDDGGPGETFIYKTLGLAAEAYLSGGAATLLEMTDLSLGNILAKFFGAEDDWLGSYEHAWDSNNDWGIGIYTDIACEEEDGTLGLRLWFTIESPGQSLTSAPAPTPAPAPEPAPTPTLEESDWCPDTSKVIVYPKLALEQGVIVIIHPDDTRILPFEIGEGERIKTFSITTVSGGGYEYFFRDSKGNFVLEGPLWPWQPDTYYLYLRNESLTSEDCKLSVTIRLMMESEFEGN